MRSSAFGLVLGALLVVASPAPALATGTVFQGLFQAVAFVENEAVVDEDLPFDAQSQTFLAAFTTAVAGLGGGSLNLDIVGNPDPSPRTAPSSRPWASTWARRSPIPA